MVKKKNILKLCMYNYVMHSDPNWVAVRKMCIVFGESGIGLNV